ncbi:MAG: Poly-beta-1,6-N-acetyl-D-glucosamine synthase [Chloroflexi bacterium ADurb.Bin360]|nr:MAG: Poly-beta-1,6-N-acetyl-D-glucosamine synthase [Chloroflexi bacterium ADurb.Bin360]
MKPFLQAIQVRLAPPQSIRDQVLRGLVLALRKRRPQLLVSAFAPATANITWHLKQFYWRFRLRFKPLRGEIISVPEVVPPPPVLPHQSTVSVVVCVHNALADVQRCLESVLRHARPVDQLWIVDDGSDVPTRDYLCQFASDHGVNLLRNETAQGYTFAANIGLKHVQTDYVVLLNSDTIVTEGWLDRLVACAESHARFGIVGPLSNTASWQSIPEIEVDGDWAENPLPAGITVDDWGHWLSRYSGRFCVRMPLLNGFCLCIKREVLQDIGYFDEENFGGGYGEEDDYILRARKAGWQPVLADDAYVFHAQSRSYSHERRRTLGMRAGEILAAKHGSRIIEQGVQYCRHDQVLAGIRARSRVMFDRQASVIDGLQHFAGKHLLFLLPAMGPGGGVNVILDEARAMQEMGVAVSIFNLDGYQEKFVQSYPSFPLPVIYGRPEQVPLLSKQYDAVIATVNTTIPWLLDVSQSVDDCVLGYYVQDFEPLLYPTGSASFAQALYSYTLLSKAHLFTKTGWTQRKVMEYAGISPSLVGPSVNIDLFRPRPRELPEWPQRPVRVAAMIRSGTLHRAPEFTMTVLERLCRQYSGSVEAWLFGVTVDDPYFATIPNNFAWKLAGVLNQQQVATFFNQVDIFVDFSSHQAMGLTAMEAMACGCAVIVPQQGGAVEFARHEENALVVDTSSESACLEALCRAVDDYRLRTRLQMQALRDICNYPPEKAALAMLKVLFNGADV